jgi:5'-AMP-activated protein kinase regulatory gamma subunit
MATTTTAPAEKGQGTTKKRSRVEEKGDGVQIPGTLKQTYSTNPEFMSMLIRMRAEQIPIADGKIFVASRTDKIVDVWKGLIKHNFLSVPVIQKTGSKYYGFLDLADIVKFFVQHFGESVAKTDADYWNLIEKEEYFKTRTVNDLMVYPLRKRNPFHPVPRGYSLFSVLEVLARERGLHRVPIIDQEYRLVHLVTQSQLVTFLNKNLNMLGDVKNKPAKMVQGFGHGVICVKENSLAMEAFNIMIHENITGVAVVDEEGKLTGNISLRDLKAISNDAKMFWRLYQDIKTFLHRVTAVDVELQSNTLRPRHMIFAQENDTIETIIKKLAEHNIHRIFICDKDQKPVGLVSLKDLLFELISNY